MTGNDIRALRLSLELTQEQLADKIGASFMSVCRWENGKSKPLPIFMERLEALQKKQTLAS